jgi:two-component system LytT family response regulator
MDHRERLARLTGGADTPPTYLKRIPVEVRGHRRFVPVEQIDCITADGPYAELRAGDQRFVVREQMQTLEERLDPARFFRIHRSTIVRLDRVDVMLIGTAGDYAVRLVDGTELRVARGRRDALAERLESLR